MVTTVDNSNGSEMDLNAAISFTMSITTGSDCRLNYKIIFTIFQLRLCFLFVNLPGLKFNALQIINACLVKLHSRIRHFEICSRKIIYSAYTIRAGHLLIGGNQQWSIHVSSCLFREKRGLIPRTVVGNRAYQNMWP